MRYIIIAIIALLLVSCSPVSYESESLVSYCDVVGDVWYAVAENNTMEEWVIYRDSIIMWDYTFSPHEQVDPNTGNVYPKYRVMSILKRKVEILEKDILRKDGDGEYIYLQYYKGYTVNEATGTKIYDWSTYHWFFFAFLTDDEVCVGMYDELKDVQTCYTFYKEPPIELDFTGW